METAHSQKYITDARITWWDTDWLRYIAERFDFKDSTSVCDLGAGAGHWGECLLTALNTRPALTSLDYEDHWAEALEQNLRLRELTSEFTVKCTDACTTGLPDDAFDLVTCQTLAMHLAEPMKLIREMTRLCTPNGTLLIAEPSNLVNRTQLGAAAAYLGPKDTAALMEAWHGYHKGVALKHGFNYDMAITLPALLKEAGFKDTQFHSFINPQAFLHVPDGSDILDEYTEDKRDLALLGGASPESWDKAKLACKKIAELSPTQTSYYWRGGTLTVLKLGVEDDAH